MHTKFIVQERIIFCHGVFKFFQQSRKQLPLKKVVELTKNYLFWWSSWEIGHEILVRENELNKKVHFPRNGIFTEVAAKKGTLFRKRFFMPNLFNNQTFNSFVNYCFSENWFPTKSKLVSCLIKSGLEKKFGFSSFWYF